MARKPLIGQPVSGSLELPPKRPRILKRPAESVPIGLILLALVVAILTTALVVLWQEGTAQQPKETPRATPTPAPVSMNAHPQLEPAPLLVSSPNDERFFAPEVRRTKYLHQTQMPYGETLIAHYLGDLPSQEALPQTGNHIGDEYSIGAYRFVWVAPYGADVGHWIDP
jgi:hypothetical protein